MKRRKNIVLVILKVFMVIFIVGYTLFLHRNLKKTYSMLDMIQVYTYNHENHTDPLKRYTLAEILHDKDLFDRHLELLTTDFTDRFTELKSPFNDGKSYRELVNEYLRYGNADLYGSGRRSGNIRRIHEGLDLFVPENTPLYPLGKIGIVTEVSNDPNYKILARGWTQSGAIDSVYVEYGKILRILYPEGVESLYAHLNEIFVEEGELVTGETIVAITGYTGNIAVSGKPSHLHLELRDWKNRSFDPLDRLHYRHTDFQNFIDTLKKTSSSEEDS